LWWKGSHLVLIYFILIFSTKKVSTIVLKIKLEIEPMKPLSKGSIGTTAVELDKYLINILLFGSIES